MGNMQAPAPQSSSETEKNNEAAAPVRNWHGLLLAGMLVNAFFVYTMLGAPPEPSVRVWYKVLVWFPFNAIATGVYLAIMMRLSGATASTFAKYFYVALCALLIVVNWTLLLAL